MKFLRQQALYADSLCLTNMYDDNNVQLDINSDTRTRGHTKKLVVRRCRYDIRKYSFSNRITNIWNSLPDEIISAPTVNTFQNRLDRFWAEQEVFYNYKANITGNKGGNLQQYNMIIYVNDYDVGIEALPTPTITLLLLLLLLIPGICDELHLRRVTHDPCGLPLVMLRTVFQHNRPSKTCDSRD